MNQNHGLKFLLIKNLRILILALLCLIFITCSFLFAASKNYIFAAINGVNLIVNIFLFKGKYRLYCLLFCTFLSSLMYTPNKSFGSFLTWAIIIYDIVIIVEIIFGTSKFNRTSILFFLLILLFSLYLIVINLINIKTNDIKKIVSFLPYLFFVCLIMCDTKSSKKPLYLLVSLSLGLLTANIFSALFVYAFKQFTLGFLELFFPKFIPGYLNPFFTFRFPGLYGDPNFNGCYIAILSSLLLNYGLKNANKKWFIILLVLALQVFAILGFSKAYFVAILLLVPLYAVLLFINKTYFPSIFLSLITSCLLLFISFGPMLLTPILKRFLSSDFRIGFLNALTTGRLELFITYIEHMLEHPLFLLFGHGVYSAPIPNVNDMHNTVVRLLWDYGIMGTIIYSLIIIFLLYSFIKGEKETLSSKILQNIPLFIFLYYSISLDLTQVATLIVLSIIFNIKDYKTIGSYKKQIHVERLTYGINY